MHALEVDKSGQILPDPKCSEDPDIRISGCPDIQMFSGNPEIEGVPDLRTFRFVGKCNRFLNFSKGIWGLGGFAMVL